MGKEYPKRLAPGVVARSGRSIQIEFRYRGERCRESFELDPAKKRNVNWTINAREQIKTEIATGRFDYAAWFPESSRAILSGPAAVTTVGDLLTRYIAACEGTLEYGTYIAYYRAAHNHLIPAFGHRPLREFGRTEVKQWLAGKPISQKRANNLLIPLRGALREAFEDGLIERNPLEGFRPRKPVGRTAEDIDPLEPDEIEAVLAAMPTEAERNLYKFLFYTGLRPEEVIGLGWDDIDWRKERVRVRRARTEGRWKGTKTKSSTRDVDLLPQAVAALEAQKPNSWMLPTVTIPEIGETVRIVFPNPRTQKHWNKSNRMRDQAWIPALRKAGVRWRPQKNTRHTFASMMLTAGAHPGWVARQLGHTSLEMVYQNYARWIESADDATTRRLKEAFGDGHNTDTEDRN